MHTAGPHYTDAILLQVERVCVILVRCGVYIVYRWVCVLRGILLDVTKYYTDSGVKEKVYACEGKGSRMRQFFLCIIYTYLFLAGVVKACFSSCVNWIVRL